MTTNTSSDRSLISLCCEPGLYFGNSSCYANNSSAAEKIILPEIYHSDLSIASFSPDEFLLRLGGIDCFVNAVYDLHSNVTEKFLIHLLENGTIYVNDSINGAKSFDTDNYCLASQMTENGPKSVVSVCLQPHQVVVLRHLIVNVILPIVSIPFLVIIFVIHALLPEMRNIQGHIFRSYIAALFLMFITMAETNLNPHCILVIGNYSCNYPSTSGIFSTVIVNHHSSYRLANIVARQFLLDERYGLRHLVDFRVIIVASRSLLDDYPCLVSFSRGFASLQRNTTLKDQRKFLIYNCYAWGIPAIITGAGVILDFLPAEWTNLIRPGVNIECDVTCEYDDAF